MHVVQHIDTPAAFAAAFPVSRETLAKLETYELLLKQWQKTINLVAPSTLDDLWHRHFADSAQLVGVASEVASSATSATGAIPAFIAGTHGPAGPKARSRGDTGPRNKPRDDGGVASEESLPRHWLDLGSGAGFPGMVVAIMLAETPGVRVTLIESDQRKSAFLREVARQTGAPVDILSTRIERAATQFRLPVADVVTARAVAPLGRLLQLVKPLLGDQGVGLFLKGRDAEREIKEARQRWQFDCDLQPSLTDDAARIMVIRNVRANSEVQP